MKTLVLIFSLVLTSTSMTYSYADSDLAAQPCMQIKKACESAKGKIKIKDCIKKITSGEKVSGVSVKSEVIQNCKEKFEK